MTWSGTHAMNWNSWYRLELMYGVKKVSAKVYGIVLVLLNHTHTKGPSIACKIRGISNRVCELFVLFSTVRLRPY